MKPQKKINLEKVKLAAFHVTLVGTSPLLMNGRTSRWVEWYKKERDKGKGEKEKTDPVEEAERGAYKDVDGNFVIPAKNILRMIRDAYGTLTAFSSGYKKMIESSVSILQLEIPLKFKSKSINESDVNVGGNKPDIRYRYEFLGWELTFTLRIRSSVELSEKKVFKILDFAGQFVGLGDGRTLGYGRFKLAQHLEKAL